MGRRQQKGQVVRVELVPKKSSRQSNKDAGVIKIKYVQGEPRGESSTIVEERSTESVEVEVTDRPVSVKENNGKRDPADLPTLVFRKILNYLSVEDLLTCSLVSKAWDKESKCVLRDLRRCWVVIKGKNPCQGFQRLEEQLRTMTLVPYNGLNIAEAWTHSPKRGCVGPKNVPAVFQAILAHSWKNLTLNWNNVVNSKYRDCPAAELMAILVQQRRKVVEFLDLTVIPRGLSCIIASRSDNEDDEEAKSRILFPNVRTLGITKDYLCRLGFKDFNEEETRSFIGDVLYHAPNVRSLCTTVNIQDVELFPSNRQKIFKEFTFYPPNTASVDWYKQLLAAKLSLRSLRARTQDGADYNLGDDRHDEEVDEAENEGHGVGWEKWRFLLPVLETSRYSLQLLQTDYVVITVLMMSGLVSPLVNVTELMLEISPTAFGVPHMPFLLRWFVSKLLPKLTKVCVTVRFLTSGYDVGELLEWLLSPEVTEFVEQQKHLYGNEPDCPPVKELSVKIDLWREEDAQHEPILDFLGQCFPAIRVFVMSTREDTYPRFEKIWQLWPALEELEVTAERACYEDALSNYDAAFCGISCEEAELLREESKTFLQNAQIVPIRPSVATMMRLRKLKINWDCSARGPAGDPSKVFLSSVTGHMAFERMPQLAVTITAPPSALKKLRHLKGFQNITLGNYR